MRIGKLFTNMPRQQYCWVSQGDIGKDTNWCTTNCLCVPSQKTCFQVDWRLLVNERIANIGIPLEVLFGCYYRAQLQEIGDIELFSGCTWLHLAKIGCTWIHSAAHVWTCLQWSVFGCSAVRCSVEEPRALVTGWGNWTSSLGQERREGLDTPHIYITTSTLHSTELTSTAL